MTIESYNYFTFSSTKVEVTISPQIPLNRNKSKPPRNKYPAPPLRLSLTNIRSKFWGVEYFLLKCSSDIPAHPEINLNSSVSTVAFFASCYLSLCLKDYRAYMHGLGVHIQEILSMTRGSFIEFPGKSFDFHFYTVLDSTFLSFFLPLSRHSSHECSIWTKISDSMEISLHLHLFLYIHLRTSCYFCDFKSLRVKLLNYSNITEVSSIQTINFSVTQSLNQIMDFLMPFVNNFNQNTSLHNLFFTSSTGPLSSIITLFTWKFGSCRLSIDISFDLFLLMNLLFTKLIFCYQCPDWE